MEMDDPILEEIHASLHSPVKTLGLQWGSSHLRCDPTPKRRPTSFWVTCWQPGLLLMLIRRKQVSDFGIALYQNESETTKAIKEVKALCACTNWDADTHQTALISKAEVWDAHCPHQGDWGWLCLHALAEAEKLLLNSHQGGRVQRHLQSPLDPTIPHQRTSNV